MTRSLTTCFLAITIGTLTGTSAFAGDFESIWNSTEYHSLRFEAPIDYEGNGDGDPELSWQVGFGVARSTIDEIGILVGHTDGDEGNRTYVAFWAEENYAPISSIVPFASVDIGYGQLTTDDEQQSLYGKVQVGGKYFVCPHCAVTGSIGLSWSLENLYLTDDGPDDKNIEVGVGLRWYY